MKPILLILDPQNDFLQPSNHNLAEFEGAVININEAIFQFRQRGWLVLFVQHDSRTKSMGSYPWEVYEGFDCHQEDPRLYKTHPDAFLETKLDSILDNCNIDFVLVCGFLAERCVLATYLGALERGHNAVILEGAVASLNSQHAESTLDIADHMTLDEFIELMDEAGKLPEKEAVVALAV